jgi:hypothetical protein
MEYRTVSTKLPSNEFTLFRAHCEKKGLTPANLMRKLIQRELQITVPVIIAGKNQLTYNKNTDSFKWLMDLDMGKKVIVLDNVPATFIENMFNELKLALQTRDTSILKNRPDSIPIPSDIIGGEITGN